MYFNFSWRKRKISRHITSILYKSTNVRTYIFFFSLDFWSLHVQTVMHVSSTKFHFGYSAIPFWPKFSTHHDVMSFFSFGFIVMLHSLHAYWPSACGFSIVCAKCLLYRIIIILFCFVFFLHNTMRFCVTTNNFEAKPNMHAFRAYGVVSLCLRVHDNTFFFRLHLFCALKYSLFPKIMWMVIFNIYRSRTH